MALSFLVCSLVVVRLLIQKCLARELSSDRADDFCQSVQLLVNFVMASLALIHRQQFAEVKRNAVSPEFLAIEYSIMLYACSAVHNIE